MWKLVHFFHTLVHNSNNNEYLKLKPAANGHYLMYEYCPVTYINRQQNVYPSEIIRLLNYLKVVRSAALGDKTLESQLLIWIRMII